MAAIDNLREAVEALEMVLTAPEHIIHQRETMTEFTSVVIIRLPLTERMKIEKVYWRLKKLTAGS